MSNADIRSNVSADVKAGQATYTPGFLKFYDLMVLGFNNRFVWRCSSRKHLKHYNRNISSNHLDVGVGTGYFLDHCRFPTSSPRLVLMDLNPHALDATARRVHRYRPEKVQVNVLEPIAFDGAPFDSIALSMVLHCVPGSITEKAVAFDNLRKHLKPGGVLFGSTVLSIGVERNYMAKKTMASYNAKGIFHNDGDSLADLRSALQARFSDVEVRPVGCFGVFSARNR